MTLRAISSICLGLVLLAAGAGGALAQATAPVFPALEGLEERVSLTVVDVTLGRAAAFLSEQTAYSVVVDPRYRELPVSVAGGDGSLAEVVSALCLAADMEPRRLDRWIVIGPAARGIAVAAREVRAESAPRVTRDARQLAAERARLAGEALLGLGLETPTQAAAQLAPWQAAALRDQGYLTVGQLFPRYYLPLYDVFGYAIIAPPQQRPPALPEFAGTRVYLDPALRVELHIPTDGAAVAWPIDIIPAGER